MREIDLKNVLLNIIKRIWLPFVLGIMGAGIMLLIDKDSAQERAQWRQQIIWSIRAPMSGETISALNYQFENQLAQTVSNLLNADASDFTKQTNAEVPSLYQLLHQNIASYTISFSNRRIEFTFFGYEQEHMQWVAEQVADYAQQFLKLEGGENIVLSTESEICNEVVSSRKSTQTIVLGALMGLCIGFAILLIIEYAKSYVETTKKEETISEKKTR